MRTNITNGVSSTNSFLLFSNAVRALCLVHAPLNVYMVVPNRRGRSSGTILLLINLCTTDTELLVCQSRVTGQSVGGSQVQTTFSHGATPTSDRARRGSVNPPTQSKAISSK